MDSTLSRREFVVTAAATVGSCAIAGTAVAAEPSMKPGTYTGEGKGCHGTLRVSVTVNEKSILSVDFVESVPRYNEVINSVDLNVDPYAVYSLAMLDETPQILDRVVDRLGDRVVEAQSTEVDAVCGATFTSMGFLAAIRDALAQAGAQDSAFCEKPGKRTDTVEYDGYDIIVVGAGASGTTAAARATALGAKVLLIDKSSRVGGCGSMSTGVHVMDTKVQKDAGVANDNETYFPEAMKQSLWYAKAPIMKQFLDNGGKAMDWLTDIGGFEFDPTPTGICYAQDSIIYPNAAQAWNKVADTVDTVLLETTVDKILVDDSGAVCGVEGQLFDGTRIVAKASKVIIATGGFMNNPDLQEQYNGAVFDTRFSMGQDKGECLQLMWDLGAKKYHIGGMNTHISQVPVEIEGVDDYTALIPYTLHAAPNFLRVNKRGERFYEENMLSENMVANGNYVVAQGGRYYTIVSRDQMDVLATQGLAGAGLTDPVFCVNFNFYTLPINYKMEHIEDAFEAGIKASFITKGETIEELAAATGFDHDAFAKAFNRYESICQAGYDDQFYKDSKYLFPMGSGPYYAIEAIVCPYSTMGGVEVDDQMRVLDTEGKPISGLYSAGVESIGALYNGAAYSDCGGFPFGWTCFSGFAAGSSAASQPLE